MSEISQVLSARQTLTLVSLLLHYCYYYYTNLQLAFLMHTSIRSPPLTATVALLVKYTRYSRIMGQVV